MLLHMYGGSWDIFSGTDGKDDAKLYSIGRRLQIKNLPELTLKSLEWCVDKHFLDYDMDVAVTVAYLEVSDENELDKRLRTLVVDYAVSAFDARRLDQRDWYEDLFAISSVFAFDFALKATKREW